MSCSNDTVRVTGTIKLTILLEQCLTINVFREPKVNTGLVLVQCMFSPEVINMDFVFTTVTSNDTKYMQRVQVLSSYTLKGPVPCVIHDTY